MSRMLSRPVVGMCALALALGGVLASPAASSAAPTIGVPVHHAYVVKVVDTSGTYTYPDTDAQILGRIDQVLARWQVESNHAITSFTRVGAMQTFDTSCADPDTVHSTVWDASATLFPGVTFSGASGNHLIVEAPEGCGGGIGQVGSVANGLNSGGKVYVDDNPSKGTQSLLHELGHNLGLSHAHALICTSGTNCSVAEYGDNYAIMGTTEEHTPPYLPASLDSFERTRFGVADTCEVPALALATGQHDIRATYDLFGRGTDQGTRGLQLTDPRTGTAYYLDWRNHAGRDSDAYYGGTTYDDGVTVEQVQNLNGTTSSILQPVPRPAPATGYHFGLTPGESYTTSGVSVHVDAADTATDAGATAQVSVTLTDPTGTDTALPDQHGTAMITGDPGPGATLTAKPTGWTPGSCYRYQWYDNGSPVTGARSSTYTVPHTAQGHRITVGVTGQQKGYAPRTATSAAVVAGTAPSAPRSARATAGKASVSLRWAAPASAGSSAVTGYRILRSDDRTHWTLRGTSTSRTYADRMLVGGTRHYYEVRAVNVAGRSAASVVVSAVPFSAPSAPRALHVAAGKKSIKVSWNAPAANHGAAVTSYTVRYATCRIGADDCHAHTRTVKARSVTIGRLKGGHRYHLVVSAANRAGRGATTAQVTATPRT